MALNYRNMENRDRKVFEAVKDLKSRFYIGTKDAWNYLKGVREYYALPEEVSERINNRLRDLPDVTYQATPERVRSICYAFLEGGRESRDELDRAEELGILDPVDSDFDLPRYFGEQHGVFNIFEADITPFDILDVDDDIIKVADSLVPFFIRANIDGAETDEGFMQSATSLIEETYQSIRHSIDHEYRAHCNMYVDGLTDKMRSIGYNNGMLPREGMFEEGTEYLNHVFRQNIFHLDMVSRILRDQVENRMEYKRAVLGEVLTDKDDILTLLYISEGGTWEHYIDLYGLFLGENRSELKDLTNFRDGIQDFEDMTTIKALEGEAEQSGKPFDDLLDEKIDGVSSHIRNLEFVRRSLASEKNWVEKFLRN